MAGNSIPTKPIGGAHLFDGKNAEFRNYECTTIVVSADTANYTIDSEVFILSDTGSASIGTSIDLMVKPKNLTAVPVGVYFLCYACGGCDTDALTGTTAPSAVYSGASQIYKPTIIGGGGLNN